MLQGNYEQIVKLISENSGQSIEDIDRKIEAKRAKLSGLISREGAAQIIASELGISFDKQKMKISGLLSGMRRINIVGKVIRIFRVVEYNKNGKSGKIASMTLADDSSNIRVVLWDTNHISLVEKGDIKEGSVVEINNGDVRNGEIHLSGFADIKVSNQVLGDVQDKPIVQNKPLIEVKMNDNIQTRAFVVQIFGPTFYNVCPQCNKKVGENSSCEAHGIVVPKKNAILTLILDDGTENIRAVLFSESIRKLINKNDIPDTEGFVPIRQDLLGKEIFVEGGVRKNKLTENLEIFVNNVSELDLDKVIAELEK